MEGNTTQTNKSDYRHLSVYEIDNNLDETLKVNIDTEDFRNYSNKLIGQFFDAKNKRVFLFKRDFTEVAQIIQSLDKSKTCV